MLQAQKDGEKLVEEFHRDIYAPPLGARGRIARPNEDEEEMALFRQAARSLK